MKRKVLFVDDDPQVLNGLRRIMSPLRANWDMEFAAGGAEALEFMACKPIDVLVTDVAMPAMNGDQLLSEVRDKFPSTIRVVLTGTCPREVLLRMIRLAHRVFIKPANCQELKSAVECACSLQTLLGNPQLIESVSQLGTLPTPPNLYTQILATLERPDASMAAVGNLIARDVGMAAKIMQMANSSLIGLRNPATSPVQAVQALGAETIKALILVSELLTRYDPASLYPFSIEELWDHCQEVALLSRRIASSERAADASEAQMTGLLHDVGRLVLATQQPESYRKVLRLVEEEELTVVEAERAVFGSTHSEVGAYLLALWGLPSHIVEAVAWHHRPSEYPSDKPGLLTAIHAAECILDFDEGCEPDEEYFERIGLTGKLTDWKGFRPMPAPAGKGR